MIVGDTSFFYSLADAAEGRHGDAVAWYAETKEPLATTPLILAELDHLVGARLGPHALRAVRRDVVEGAYAIEWWRTAAAESAAIAERYEELGVGLADASLVALATRLGTTAIATFDDRHFRAMRPVAGAAAFTLLPADRDA